MSALHELVAGRLNASVGRLADAVGLPQELDLFDGPRDPRRIGGRLIPAAAANEDCGGKEETQS
jgi:hypothetical protein